MRREEIHPLAKVAVKEYTQEYSINGEDPDYKDLDMQAVYKRGYRDAISRVLQAHAQGRDVQQEFEDVLT